MRLLRHMGTVGLALMATIGFVSLFFLVVRLHVGPWLMTILLSVPVIVLILSIVDFRKRRRGLVLTFGISFLILSIVVFGVIFVWLLLALRSVT